VSGLSFDLRLSLLRNLARVALASLLVAECLAVSVPAEEPHLDWTHFVTIGAYGLNRHNAVAIVRDAQASGVYGIEVDNDIPGRYESFLDPTEKLAAVRELADTAHRAGNKAFVYIAGTECITAHAAQSPHSLAKDHPDWLQRKINGEPAIFGGGDAFWIRAGDEDVWVSPLAPEWRKVYMQRVRQIAATGIDGIYVDIPYWMTHFTGWENTWASFDDYTVRAFRAETGLDAKHDLKLGDFSDTNFRRWVEFRMRTLTDFVREIRDSARSVRPHIKVIPEIYPGIEEEAVRVGADVYQMYAVVDAVAHEYEFGEGEHMASSRTQLDWLLYQVGMLSFRAFAEGKATWILNYSWDGDKGVDPREAMKNLAMSELAVGANFWDAAGHEMANSNDLATRTEIFAWIKRYRDHIYGVRDPICPVGVYFSPASRDFAAQDFLPSYRGIVLLLLRKHRQVEIVTPRTLDKFRGRVLVLPNVSSLEDPEKSALSTYQATGGKIVLTGTDPLGTIGRGKVARFPRCPGKEFLSELQEDAHRGLDENAQSFLETLSTPDSSAAEVAEVTVDAPSLVVAYTAAIHRKIHFYFANFEGLAPHAAATPLPQSDVRITAPAEAGDILHFVPFLGPESLIAGSLEDKSRTFQLPKLERGAIAWLEAAK
jgi:endo-alpha-1,4-polygalactosaminidase (GH114 family)